MKEVGTVHWLSPNTDATNSSGFTGLPGGNRYTLGTFNAFASIGFLGKWWVSVEDNNVKAWTRYMDSNISSVTIYTDEKTSGLSVRCIKD